MNTLAYWQNLPWNEIRFKANKYLPKLTFIALVILLTQTFAELTWDIFTPAEKNTSHSRTINSSAVQVPPSTQPSRLSEVSDYHLFGDAKKQVVVQEKVIDAPETRLRLDLKGVFASTIKNEALAIISSAKDKDKTYHIGDKVFGGALLHAVYPDRVILKRNGKLETLRLPKPKVDSKAFYNPSPPATKTSRNSRSTGVAYPAATSNQTQRLRTMRETLLKDPAKIWQQIRINPVMKNGEVQGYTLAHNDQALMKALNLKKTDIITAVNGQSLSDPSTLYGLMGSLSDQDSLEVSIERNGQPQTIQLSF